MPFSLPNYTGGFITSRLDASLLKNTSRCCIIHCLEPPGEKIHPYKMRRRKKSRQSYPFFVESRSISRRRRAGRCTAAVFVTLSSLSRSDTASTALGIEGGREGGHRHRPPPVLRSGAEGRHFSSIFPPPLLFFILPDFQEESLPLR